MWAGGPPKPTQPIRPHSRSTAASRRALTAGARRGGLEQFDRVAGRVLEQDLLAARAGDDVVAERQPGGAQPLDLGGDVVDDQMDAVPAARPGRPAVGHRPAGRAGRTAQQQPQLAADDVGEGRRGVQAAA